MDNKFPGKDISDSDLKDKFPLAAKKSPNHYSRFSKYFVTTLFYRFQ